MPSVLYLKPNSMSIFKLKRKTFNQNSFYYDYHDYWDHKHKDRGREKRLKWEEDMVNEYNKGNLYPTNTSPKEQRSNKSSIPATPKKSVDYGKVGKASKDIRRDTRKHEGWLAASKQLTHLATAKDAQRYLERNPESTHKELIKNLYNLN